MADNEVSTEPIRTPTDLAIEELRNELANLKAESQKTIAELTEANKGLWSALHPAKITEPVNSEPVVQKVKDSADASLEAFNRTLGIEKE